MKDPKFADRRILEKDVVAKMEEMKQETLDRISTVSNKEDDRDQDGPSR